MTSKGEPTKNADQKDIWGDADKELEKIQAWTDEELASKTKMLSNNIKSMKGELK